MFIFKSIKRELKTRPIMIVGVMKDYNLKMMNLHVSHTLGCSGEFLMIVYYSRIKKGEGQGKNVTLETMIHSKPVKL